MLDWLRYRTVQRGVIDNGAYLPPARLMQNSDQLRVADDATYRVLRPRRWPWKRTPQPAAGGYARRSIDDWRP